MAEAQTSRADNMSVGQIQAALRHVKAEAAEKLSTNDRLNDLRQQLWQNDILSQMEFDLLGTTSDEEGPLGMAQKLIDLMLEKKVSFYQHFWHSLEEFILMKPSKKEILGCSSMYIYNFNLLISETVRCRAK